MKKRLTYIIPLLFIIAISFQGCNLSSLEDETTERVYSFDSVDMINVKSNIFVTLIQDSLNYISISALDDMQEDLVPVVDGDIELKNRNHSKTFNRYNYQIEAEIHFTEFRYLFYQGGGDVVSRDTIRMDRLQIASNGATGTVDLKVVTNSISLGMSTGTLDVILHGKTDVVSSWSTSYARLDLLELDAKRVVIRNNSPGDNYVNALESIDAKVQSIGDIYYTGKPAIRKIEETGSGKAIKME